jgi:hypothetical protein
MTFLKRSRQAQLRQRAQRSDIRDSLLMRRLLSRQFLGLNGLVENAELRALVLQHHLFGLYSRLEIQDGLLIGRAADGIDQLLKRCEAAAGGGQRLLGYRLQGRRRVSGGLDLLRCTGGRAAICCGVKMALAAREVWMPADRALKPVPD